jgi:hypothetical protein
VNGWFNLALVELNLSDYEAADAALARAAALPGLTPEQAEQIAQLEEALARLLADEVHPF